MVVEDFELFGNSPEVLEKLALHVGQLLTINFYTKDLVVGIAIHAVDVVVDQDLELERVAVGIDMPDLTVMLDYFSYVGPGFHVGQMGQGADVNFISHKALAKIFGFGVREKRVESTDLVS